MNGTGHGRDYLYEEMLKKFKWTETLSLLVLFEREAKRRGFTVKVVGDYAYKKSRRHDSPRIQFAGTTENGIRMKIFRTNKEVEYIEVKHGINVEDDTDDDEDEEIADEQLRACLDWLYKS